MTRATGGQTRPCPSHSSCHFWEDFCFVDNMCKYAGTLIYQPFPWTALPATCSVSPPSSMHEEDTSLLMPPRSP